MLSWGSEVQGTGCSGNLTIPSLPRFSHVSKGRQYSNWSWSLRGSISLGRQIWITVLFWFIMLIRLCHSWASVSVLRHWIQPSSSSTFLALWTNLILTISVIYGALDTVYIQEPDCMCDQIILLGPSLQGSGSAGNCLFPLPTLRPSLSYLLHCRAVIGTYFLEAIMRKGRGSKRWTPELPLANNSVLDGT